MADGGRPWDNPAELGSLHKHRAILDTSFGRSDDKAARRRSWERVVQRLILEGFQPRTAKECSRKFGNTMRYKRWKDLFDDMKGAAALMDAANAARGEAEAAAAEEAEAAPSLALLATTAADEKAIKPAATSE